MAEHHAVVEWARGDATFLDNRYSRAHRWSFDGGATVAASASPHVVPIPLSDPAAVDPEEAFVASLSSCHMLFFLSFAAKQGFLVDGYRDDAVGRMGRDADGRTAMLEVILRPAVRFAPGQAPTDEELDRLYHAAHDACFIANSVKTGVRCEPVAPAVSASAR